MDGCTYFYSIITPYFKKSEMQQFYLENLEHLHEIIQKDEFNFEDACVFQNVMMLFGFIIIGGQRLELITHFTEKVYYF